MASGAEGRPPATVVGNAFVCQYYHTLYQSPELGHRFYQDMSKLTRPEQDGQMSTTTTLPAINEKIRTIRGSDPDCKTEIVSIISQDSHRGGVFVLVSGFMTGKGSPRRAFVQTFFLAPHGKGYFVCNDILRYVPETPKPGKVDARQASLTTEADQDSEKFAPPVENASGEGVSNPPEHPNESTTASEDMPN